MEEDNKKLPLIDNEEGDLETTKLNMTITIVNHLKFIAEQIDTMMKTMILCYDKINTLVDKTDETVDKLTAIDDKLFDFNIDGIEVKPAGVYDIKDLYDAIGDVESAVRMLK